MTFASQNLENPIAKLLCKCHTSLDTDDQKGVDHLTGQLQVRSETTSSTTHRVWLFVTKNTAVLRLWGGCGGAQPPHHTTQSLDKNIPTVMVFVTAILQGSLCAPTSFKRVESANMPFLLVELSVLFFSKPIASSPFLLPCRFSEHAKLCVLSNFFWNDL